MPDRFSAWSAEKQGVALFCVDGDATPTERKEWVADLRTEAVKVAIQESFEAVARVVSGSENRATHYLICSIRQ